MINYIEQAYNYIESKQLSLSDPKVKQNKIALVLYWCFSGKQHFCSIPVIPMGHTPLDVISANDVGPVVRAAFADPQSFLHKTLSLSGSKLTVKEIAAILAKHLPGKCFKVRMYS